MNYQKMYKEKYFHALGRMYDLFKLGHEYEVKLETAIELAKDELLRIKACPGADSEIKQLCDRGLNDIKRLVEKGE